jgi:AraC family transcriptional regulator
MDIDSRPVVSAASLRCASMIPSKRCVSSRELGWSSLLLDVHSGMTWDQPYSSVPTLDPRIGVSLSGSWMVNFCYRGTWQRDVSEPGTTTLLRLEDDQRFRLGELRNNDCHFAHIYFPLAQLAATVEHLRRPGQRSSVPMFNRVHGKDRAVAQVARALIMAMRQGASELYAETVSAWLATHLLVQSKSYVPWEDDRNAGDITDARLSRVIEFMSVHYGEQLTLERLAAEAGISKYHFTRLFREKVGQTPYRFLSEIRLETAAKMLVTTDLRVGEIASLCGHETVPHFTTAFSARYGAAPMEFRAARSERHASAARDGCPDVDNS